MPCWLAVERLFTPRLLVQSSRGSTDGLGMDHDCTHMDDDVATTFRGFLLDSPKIWGLEVKAQTLSSCEHARERASAMSRERGCRTDPRASGRGFRLMS